MPVSAKQSSLDCVREIAGLSDEWLIGLVTLVDPSTGEWAQLLKPKIDRDGRPEATAGLLLSVQPPRTVTRHQLAIMITAEQRDLLRQTIKNEQRARNAGGVRR